MAKAAAVKKTLLIESAGIDTASQTYRAILHPLRLKIIALIHQAGRMHVSKLIAKLKLEQAVVSQQLRILREAQIVEDAKEGRTVFYSVNYAKLAKLVSATKKLSPSSHAYQQIKKTSKISSQKQIISSPKEFTPREIEIVKLICDQKQNVEIAKKLKLSKRTIEGHRDQIISKMKVRNTAGLVVYAIRHGLYEL